jgi:hypothetical protein
MVKISNALRPFIMDIDDGQQMHFSDFVVDGVAASRGIPLASEPLPLARHP